MNRLFISLLEDSRVDNRKSLELYSSVELPCDRYEPPMVLMSRDWRGARLLEAVSPDSFELRCAELMADDALELEADGPGARSSSSG